VLQPPLILDLAALVGRAVPFVFSDLGWVLAAAALILGLAVLLQVFARRPVVSSRPLRHRSTDP
jgi:hypothetical protein